FGYYTTVYITGGKWNKFLYCAPENQNIRKWISEAVSEGRALLIGPWDGSPDSFRYYVWGEEEEDSGYVTWKEDAKVEECPMFSAELADRIKRLKLSGEPLERRCNFGPYLFNRELWSRYNNKQIEEAREAQNDDELIQSLQKKAEELEKERKALLERVKSTEQLNEELREKNRDLNREKKELQRSAGEPKENPPVREGESEADRRLESLKKRLTESVMEPRVLFEAPKDWEAVLPIVRRELIQRLREGFERLLERRNKQESPTRREDVLGFLYLINQSGEEKDGSEPGVLLKYPVSEELYENEYSTLLLETLWRENDPLIACLAKEEGYNKAWRDELKRSLLNDIDNYRNVSSIRAVLGNNGIEPDGGGKHDKWAFHGDDRYTVTIACTPGDKNAGKNVVEDILDRFF
ncbi:MAG: hypothetical protein IJ873_01150, partial [Lachnospiraceae bacterium]|nr:hypothetical protein [Lachnospiraceae bacterium]